MRAIELFAGVGGFRIGLERAGHQVVWSNEWDKYACDVYDRNFGDRITRGDITLIAAEDIPEHDLIAGGFPCQAFSIAGKRKGFDETRGTLFFDIMRIASHHRTPYLLLENVRGLLNHDGGRTFQVILRTLDEHGYDAQWQVLNSKDFGVPQNRERVIIVGHLRGASRPEVFPLGESGSWDYEPQAEARGEGQRLRGDDSPVVANTLAQRDYKGGNNLIQINEKGRSVAERVYDPSGVSMTLSALGGGMGAKTGLYAINQLNPGAVQDQRVYDKDGISPTINPAAGAGGAVIPKIITGSPSYDENGDRSMKYHITDEAPTIRATQYKSGDNQPKVLFQDVQRFNKNQNGKGFKGIDAESYTVDTLATQGVGIPIPEATKQGYAIAQVGDSINLQQPNSQTRRGRVGRGVAQTVDTSMHQHTIDPTQYRIRRLTPRECERLQAFPDDWTRYGLREDGTEYLISDTQRYKMCGNAVTTNVIYEVAKRLPVNCPPMVNSDDSI